MIPYPDPGPAQDQDHGEDPGRDGQRDYHDRLAVGGADDDQRDQVIDDRDRQQERADPVGDTAVPRAACCLANALPLKPLSASRARGGGPASSRSAATSRSLTAAGTMLQARTIRLPRSVLMASRKP